MTRWLFHLCPEFFQRQFLRLSRLWSPDVATVQMYRNRNGSTPCMPPKFQSNLRNSIFARGAIFLQNFPVLSICLSRLPESQLLLLPPITCFAVWEAIVAWQCESHSDPMYVTISTSVLMWITIWPSVCDSLPSAHAPSMRHNLKSGKKRSVNISCHDCASVWHPSPTPFS